MEVWVPENDPKINQVESTIKENEELKKRLMYIKEDKKKEITNLGKQHKAALLSQRTGLRDKIDELIEKPKDKVKDVVENPISLFKLSDKFSNYIIPYLDKGTKIAYRRVLNTRLDLVLPNPKLNVFLKSLTQETLIAPSPSIKWKQKLKLRLLMLRQQ